MTDTPIARPALPVFRALGAVLAAAADQADRHGDAEGQHIAASLAVALGEVVGEHVAPDSDMRLALTVGLTSEGSKHGDASREVAAIAAALSVGVFS